MTSGRETGNAPPWRWLAGLTLAVLALHLVLLQARPGEFSLGASPAARALLTRSISAGLPPAQQSLTTPAPAPTQAAPPGTTPIAGSAHENSATPPARPSPAVEAAVASKENETSPLVNTESVATKNIAPSAPLESTATQASMAAPGLPVASSFAIPGSIQLRYVVRGVSRQIPYEAQAKLVWRHDGNEYEARLEIATGPLALRQQNSTGHITPEGLAPDRFSDKTRSEVATHFERAKGKIVFSSNAPDAALQPGAQDRLSVLLQLGAIVGAAPERYTAGTTLEVQTAGARDADLWVFTVSGTETQQLPGGELTTLKLVRQPRHAFDQTVELWLAPDLDYMPARIRLSQANGDAVDQLWKQTDQK